MLGDERKHTMVAGALGNEEAPEDMGWAGTQCRLSLLLNACVGMFCVLPPPAKVTLAWKEDAMARLAMAKVRPGHGFMLFACMWWGLG
jgi:hypothetical protein